MTRRGVARRALHLGPLMVLTLASVWVGAIAMAWWLGSAQAPATAQAEAPDPRPDLLVAAMGKHLNELRGEVASARQRADHDLDALSQQLSGLHARAIRIDALGARLVDMVGLDPGEFSFDRAPALGGPAPADSGHQTQAMDLTSALDELSLRLARRVQELEILEKSLLEARVAEQMHPKGRPISVGWMSSHFGWRGDPLTGRRSFHEGIDFAGPTGSPIFAVAAGIVVFSGVRSGFGNVVEVDHGRGYVTRYAHNKKNLVKRGVRVAKGQKIATMGRSGRATGTHLHFEVLLNDKPLNPITFIERQQSGADSGKTSASAS